MIERQKLIFGKDKKIVRKSGRVLAQLVSGGVNVD